MTTADVIAGNLATIKERIAAALARAGRAPDSVTIIAVSKTHPPDVIREARLAGQRHFGENRVQELTKKRDALAGLDVEWHFVGTLQTNKVRQLLPFSGLIHSLDRPSLAAELAKRAQALGRTQPCLVQVNVAAEATKAGLAPDDVIPFVRRVATLPGVSIQGLMTIAPLVADPEQVRPVFRRLRELADEIRALRLPAVDMRHLSMGMTNDYLVAVEEGATLVRLGRAIFGDRREA